LDSIIVKIFILRGIVSVIWKMDSLSYLKYVIWIQKMKGISSKEDWKFFRGLIKTVAWNEWSSNKMMYLGRLLDQENGRI